MSVSESECECEYMSVSVNKCEICVLGIKCEWLCGAQCVHGIRNGLIDYLFSGGNMEERVSMSLCVKSI